ncbi:MAG: signal transduction histidine kinase [Deltaproteobacteria bacterium]|nr:signal transduction histidine kinase [Deltaproteobacteria bacterium]
MNEPVPLKRRWIFRPLSVLIIWGILALLLVLNGLYESKRAKDNLYRLLADEGAALIDGLARSAQSSLNFLAALETQPGAAMFIAFSSVNLLTLEESVIDWVLEIAGQIDQRLGSEAVTPERLEGVGREERIAGVEVVSGRNHLVFHRQPETMPREGQPPFYLPLTQGKASYAIQRTEKRAIGQMDFLSVAILRRAGEGILILRTDETDIQHLRRRVILQGIIDEWAGKVDIQYLRFQGKDGEFWAGFDVREGRDNNEERAWFGDHGLQTDHPGAIRSRSRKGIFEVGQSVSLDVHTQGFLLVGLNTAKVDQIIGGDIRNLVLFSFFLLAFAGIGIVLIYRLENRHLARVIEMEEKIQRSEKLSSLANLAAGVAHEIRNPLNAIGMAIQRLQREFPQKTAELQEEYFQFTDILRGEVKRINDIVEQFLFFARPAHLKLQPLKLKDLFQDLMALASEPARQQNVVLEEETDPDLPLIMADRQRLQEALWNLIQNGLQAMSKGGKLRLSAILQHGKAVRIGIEDTGEGIPDENHGKVFDYYFTTRKKGTGLGLPLAHKIIQEHGGSISLRSKVGQGTTFEIILPVFEEGK